MPLCYNAKLNKETGKATKTKDARNTKPRSFTTKRKSIDVVTANSKQMPARANRLSDPFHPQISRENEPETPELQNTIFNKTFSYPTGEPVSPSIAGQKPTEEAQNTSTPREQPGRIKAAQMLTEEGKTLLESSRNIKSEIKHRVIQNTK